ncbi:MAG TPA: carbohydrate-binding protein [Vicinamibacterales bacterium]|nr:carbohydrate-binding protein [Vicinamibacterales bacterium]
MKIHRASAVTLVLLLTAAVPAAPQDRIAVDLTSVLSDVSRKPIGVNVNYLLDADANRPAAIQSLAAALKRAGVRYLRYPGGEKSDGYLWSVPPYTSSIPTLARWATGEYPQNQEWPSYDRDLVAPDGRTFRITPLGFDEFMDICREIGCVPTVVVCYDSMYKPAQTGGVAPTREQLLETAREWVRYANVTKGYKVRYWEIGNESWQFHFNGGTTAANYARDLIEFSRVMKAVDPGILIGANGESDSWWQTVLSTASSAIDFLAVHNYPAMNWGSYSYYRNNNVNLMTPVQIAQRAIETYVPAGDRARLSIASTEINSADWSGGWPHRNDLGHALVVFDIFGAHLVNPGVAFTQLWNTRWSGNDTATTPVLWDALNRLNELQATGRAAAIWGQFLKAKMVSASSTAMVRSYATYSPADGRFSVFLINKDTAPRPASVTTNSGSAHFLIDTWVFSGQGDTDIDPAWVHGAPRSNAGNVMAIELPPVSVTVLDVTPVNPVHAVPGTIQAEDFRDTGYWDSTGGNAGGRYRATDVDIEAASEPGAGFNIGWIAAGEWLEYVIQVPTAGYYDLSARVASPYSGKSMRLLLNGQETGTGITVPQTGGWQAWQTVTRPAAIYLPAGTHRAAVVADTDGFNLNWIAFSASDGPVHATPGTIQAEDFRDGGYWDSTPGNSGGLYRATDVDVQASSDSGGGFNVGWIAAGEWLEYPISVATAGSYDLAVRVASPYAGKAFRVLVNGADATGSVAVPSTGGWQSWQTVTRSGIPLPAGRHRLTVVAITNGFNLNWLAVTSTPAKAHALPGTVQAEDFDDGRYLDSTTGNLGSAYRATDVDIEATQDSGGGFNVGWIAAGEWLEYTIQIPTAGDYDLSARVASPYTGKSFRILVDGIDVTGDMTVPNTGGYQRWQTVTRSRVPLAAGTHRLRYAATTNGFNVNWFAVEASR